jgi:hypothetical protein
MNFAILFSLSAAKDSFERYDMQSLFDPVMDDIIGIVSEQVKLAEEMSERKLDVSVPHNSLANSKSVPNN